MTVTSEQEAAAYYNSRPKKRTGAGVLIVNARGELLIVKPTYLDRWLCPGGGVEEDESPLAAAKRECKEEIGVEFDELWPAYIDYRERQPDGQTDIVQFMFTPKPVDDSFLDILHLQAEEIEDAKFVSVEQLPHYFSRIRAKTVMAYFQNRAHGSPIYMENGELIA
jgi:8-oxo-dGTP diphosphatase